LISGFVGWLGGEKTNHYFKPILEPIPDTGGMSPYFRSSLMAEQELRKRPAAEAKNTALAYGLLGAALGGTLGLAGGLARRNARAGVLAACSGLVIGGLAGAGLSEALVLGVFYPNLTPETGLLMPFLVHSGIWAAVGAAGGIALGLGLGNHRLLARAALGGLVGAIVGALVFEIFNAMEFAVIRVEAPIPGHPAARLAAHLCTATAVAAGAVLGVSEAKSRNRSVRAIGVA
jgi:hypothetical protein